jgi:hypothetical protein
MAASVIRREASGNKRVDLHWQLLWRHISRERMEDERVYEPNQTDDSVVLTHNAIT